MGVSPVETLVDKRRVRRELQSQRSIYTVVVGLYALESSSFIAKNNDLESES